MCDYSSTTAEGIVVSTPTPPPGYDPQNPNQPGQPGGYGQPEAPGPPGGYGQLPAYGQQGYGGYGYGAPAGADYASWGSRVGASLLDGLIQGVPGIIGYVIFLSQVSATSGPPAWAIII